MGNGSGSGPPSEAYYRKVIFNCGWKATSGYGSVPISLFVVFFADVVKEARRADIMTADGFIHGPCSGSYLGRPSSMLVCAHLRRHLLHTYAPCNLRPLRGIQVADPMTCQCSCFCPPPIMPRPLARLGTWCTLDTIILVISGTTCSVAFTTRIRSRCHGGLRICLTSGHGRVSRVDVGGVGNCRYKYIGLACRSRI